MTTRRRGLVLVRGAGDLATGAIVRLVRAGFRVAALEVPAPTAIRRAVALSEAVYDGGASVEGVEARLAACPAEALELAAAGLVPVLIDPGCASLEELAPMALVDAILAKRNLGTSPAMAPIVVALGPGFEAPRDAHAVVETNRGHGLGRAIYAGGAEPDTGLPGIVGGRGEERVLRAGADGVVEALRDIGSRVEEGEAVALIRPAPGGPPSIAAARVGGALRGVIRPGSAVLAGAKIADVDPRGERAHCFTVSDKSLAVGGGVLEAVLSLGGRPE